MKVNFVMSNEVESGIFNSIIGYFVKYFINERDQLVVSVAPVDDADIYHYHRPNLETKLKPNSVVTIHHDLADFDPWFSIEKFIEAYKQADRIVCLNSAQQMILKQYNLENKSLIIPHGINNEIFKKAFTQKQNESKFVKVGFISKRYARLVKGERYLYELANLLDTNIQFVLVGNERYTDAEYLYNLGFQTFVYETIPYDIMPIIYNELDALLILSKFEGGPASVPEAIYSGTPIIGTQVGMLNDYVPSINLSNSIVADAKMINKFVLDLNYRKNIFKQAFELTHRVHTWQDIIEQHRSLYQTMINIRG